MYDRLWVGLQSDWSWIVTGFQLDREGRDPGKDRLTGARLRDYRYAGIDHARLFRYLYEGVRPPKSGDEVQRSWALRTIAVSSS
jgi:hypothetical protein